LVDFEEGKVVNEVEVENPGHAPGYIPQFLHEKGVRQIVCGGMGMRAQGLFAEFGIETFLGVEGSINSVIEKLEQGLLESKESKEKLFFKSYIFAEAIILK
jgi:predicted Fe-Mo cluster-binding NifX family protein